MTKIQLVFYFIVATIFLGCKEPTAPQPNILWISVEDLSPRLSCYGDSIAHTPNIDRLAKEGVVYDHAYTVAGVCAPSRASIITGLYPSSFGAQHMRNLSRTSAIKEITDPAILERPLYEAVPPPDVKCFTEFLRVNGYYCTNNAKEDYQFTKPITAWDESSNNAHWRNREDGQAFFAVFNIGITHEAQVWTRADDPLEIDSSLIEVPPYYPNSPVIRKDIARHYNNIQLMDQKVGEILTQLEEDGLMDNTIIFFFSDHGDGLPRAKRWIYDSGIRVPLIVRWPDGTGKGSRNDELVSFIDLAPTILSLTDIKIPAYMHGQAFLGAQQSPPRKYIYAIRDRMGPSMDNQRAVRTKQYKFIQNYMPGKPYVQLQPYRDRMDLMKELLRMNEEDLLRGPQKLWFRKKKPPIELYDCLNDPYELNNLANDPEYRLVLGELRTAHIQWIADYQDYGLMPENILKNMLWPPDGRQPVTSKVELNRIEQNGATAKIALSCTTPGASIGYKFSGKENSWNIYVEPLELKEGDSLITKASRIGFMHSEEQKYKMGSE